MSGQPEGTERKSFGRTSRVCHALLFRAVYEKGAKRTRGPLTVFALPNGLTGPRLGLSVGRRVGGAVRRNAVKRRLREAFRLARADFPHGYDLVVTVRPHDPMKTAEYQKLLCGAWGALHRELSRAEPGDGR